MLKCRSSRRDAQSPTALSTWVPMRTFASRSNVSWRETSYKHELFSSYHRTLEFQFMQRRSRMTRRIQFCVAIPRAWSMPGTLGSIFFWRLEGFPSSFGALTGARCLCSFEQRKLPSNPPRRRLLWLVSLVEVWVSHSLPLPGQLLPVPFQHRASSYPPPVRPGWKLCSAWPSIR